MKATLALIFLQWFHLSFTCHENLMFSEILLKELFLFCFYVHKHTYTIVPRKGKSRKKYNIVLLVHYYVIDVNYWKTIYPPTLVLSLMDLDTGEAVDVQGIIRAGFWQLSQNTKEKQSHLAIHRCLIFI